MDQEELEKVEEIEETSQVEEIRLNDGLQTTQQQQKRLSRIFTGISFGMVWFALLLAVIFDFIAFKDVILHFVAGIIVTGIAFVFLTVMFVASFILVFGFLIIDDYGFWPLKLTVSLFKDILGDIHISAESVQLFFIFRIILFVICIAIVVLAIIAKAYIKQDKAKGLYNIKDNTTGMSTAALTMGIIGMLLSLPVVAVVSALQI